MSVSPKAFELERMLLDDASVERLFNSDTATALHTVMSGGMTTRPLPQADHITLMETNELLRWLVNVSCSVLSSECCGC